MTYELKKEKSQRHDVASTNELAWLHNGFDEDAMRSIDEEDLEQAMDADAKPKHWHPVDVERVG